MKPNRSNIPCNQSLKTLIVLIYWKSLPYIIINWITWIGVYVQGMSSLLLRY